MAIEAGGTMNQQAVEYPSPPSPDLATVRQQLAADDRAKRLTAAESRQHGAYFRVQVAVVFLACDIAAFLMHLLLHVYSPGGLFGFGYYTFGWLVFLFYATLLPWAVIAARRAGQLVNSLSADERPAGDR